MKADDMMSCVTRIHRMEHSQLTSHQSDQVVVLADGNVRTGFAPQAGNSGSPVGDPAR